MIVDADQCPVCKTHTTEHWSGYLGIVDPDKSEIAKKIAERMEIKVLKAKYALNVR